MQEGLQVRDLLRIEALQELTIADREGGDRRVDDLTSPRRSSRLIRLVTPAVALRDQTSQGAARSLTRKPPGAVWP